MATADQAKSVKPPTPARLQALKPQHPPLPVDPAAARSEVADLDAAIAEEAVVIEQAGLDPATEPPEALKTAQDVLDGVLKDDRITAETPVQPANDLTAKDVLDGVLEADPITRETPAPPEDLAEVMASAEFIPAASHGSGSALEDDFAGFGAEAPPDLASEGVEGATMAGKAEEGVEVMSSGAPPDYPPRRAEPSATPEPPVMAEAAAKAIPAEAPPPATAVAETTKPEADPTPLPARTRRSWMPTVIAEAVSFMMSYPLRMVPPRWRFMVDLVALSLVFWVPIVWTLALILTR